jgi:hypothetical protein
VTTASFTTYYRFRSQELQRAPAIFGRTLRRWPRIGLTNLSTLQVIGISGLREVITACLGHSESMVRNLRQLDASKTASCRPARSNIGEWRKRSAVPRGSTRVPRLSAISFGPLSDFSASTRRAKGSAGECSGLVRCEEGTVTPVDRRPLNRFRLVVGGVAIRSRPELGGSIVKGPMGNVTFVLDGRCDVTASPSTDYSWRTDGRSRGSQSSETWSRCLERFCEGFHNRSCTRVVRERGFSCQAIQNRFDGRGFSGTKFLRFSVSFCGPWRSANVQGSNERR